MKIRNDRESMDRLLGIETALLSFLDEQAKLACHDADPHNVHFFVDAQHKVHRLCRQLGLRIRD